MVFLFTLQTVFRILPPCVLILVVMVFLFTRSSRVNTDVSSCLNPCCDGISFYGSTTGGNGSFPRLNPCCDGISFYVCSHLHFRYSYEVLILVVMVFLFTQLGVLCCLLLVVLILVVMVFLFTCVLTYTSATLTRS